MITILMVLMITGVEVTVDMTQWNGTQTIEECYNQLPEMQMLWKAESAFCAAGDILIPLREEI